MKLKRIIASILTAVLLFAVTMSVSAYNTVYFSENFTDADSVYSKLIMSNDWRLNKEGCLYGYAGAKVIQTCPCTIPEWWENYPSYSYVDYDMTITLTAVDDDESNDDRFVNLVYVNDNVIINMMSNERVYMSFIYDFQENCFRFTDGLCQTDPDKQIMPPVYMEICDDGSEFYTLGMTVERDRIRCFYNDELIFDFVDTEQKYFIADKIDVPALFWQEGNFVQVSNISVDKPGYLTPPSYVLGDADGDGTVNLTDVTIVMKNVAKCKNAEVDKYAADFDRNGRVNLSDVSLILKYIAKWDGIVLK